MASQIQTRRDTLNNWATTNPTLAQGEVGWVIGSNDFKIGDGITAWNSLPYIQFGEIPNNGTLTIQKNGETIATFTANQAGDTTANIIADTPEWGNITGPLSSQVDLSQALASKLTTADILNVLNSTAIDKALSANMGKSLQDQVDNLKARGRFLALWNCATGLAQTNPPENTYEYKAGDYFIVGVIASAGGTNYKPTGSSYTTGVASTAVETADVAVDDVYYYDGTHWALQINTQKEVAFINIAGDPYDNTNLGSALNAKQDEIDQNNMLSADLVDDTSSTNKFVTSTDITNWNGKVDANTAITGATKCKITYDSKGLVTAGGDLASSDVTNALGYTPYSNANPSGYQANVLEGVKVNGTDLTIGVDKKVNIDLTDYVTTNTIQTISGTKTFTGSPVFQANNYETLIIRRNSQSAGALVTYSNTSGILARMGINGLGVPIHIPTGTGATIRVLVRGGSQDTPAVGDTSTPVYIDSDGISQACTNVQEKSTIQTLSATDTITLTDNTIYSGSTQTSLTINLWASPTVSSICEVMFTSGSTPTVIPPVNTIKWLDGGTDVSGNEFTPESNKRYTIIFYYDGANTCAIVKGV